MLIHVDTNGRRHEVRDVDDLARFGVVVAGQAEGELAASLVPLARLDPDGAHVWVSIEGLRAACARAGDARWQAAFDGMVAYAADHGWVDETGSDLRAHIEIDAVDDADGDPARAT